MSRKCFVYYVAKSTYSELFFELYVSKDIIYKALKGFENFNLHQS